MKMLNESNLHGYQKTAIEHILKNNASGLFLDMGLGKTVSALTAINTLIYKEVEINNVLVIAPKRVVESVWTAEIKKWDHLKYLTTSKVIGTPKQRKIALTVEANIYLISRDNIAWLVGQYGGSMLPFDMLVIDESSSFKSPKSQRFKALKMVQPSFDRIVLLTGTPAPNSLEDLWSQLYLLDRGQRLGKFISKFRDEYFKPGKRNGAIIYNYNIVDDGEKRIYDKIGDICISMKAKDYLDLPERINNYIEVKFPPDIQAKYDDFEKEQVLKLFDNKEGEEAKEITAVNAAALSNKLLQFANGAVYDENRDVHEMHHEKLDAAEEIIESAQGKPVLIAWTYRHDMYRMMKRFKKYSPRQLKTDQDINDWNAGKIKILLMHPASGGHGLNLQAGGHIIIWFGQTWSLELYQQLNARLDRQGLTERVIVNHLVATKTIDQDVIRALRRKDKRQEGLLLAVKARINKYIK